MTYDPSHSSISSTIQKYLPILHSSRRCKDAIPKPAMVAFRRPINIKDMVVRSSIRVPSAEPPGFNPCNHCAACKHTHNSSVVEHTATSHTFSSHSSGQQFTIKHHLHCLSTNVMYLINYKKRGFQYIGETKRTLRPDSLNTMGIPNTNVTNQSLGISTNPTTQLKISSSWPSIDLARMTPITDWPLIQSGLRNLKPSTPLVSMSKVTIKISPFSPPFSPYPWSVLPVSLCFS